MEPLEHKVLMKRVQYDLSFHVTILEVEQETRSESDSECCYYSRNNGLKRSKSSDLSWMNQYTETDDDVCNSESNSSNISTSSDRANAQNKLEITFRPSILTSISDKNGIAMSVCNYPNGTLKKSESEKDMFENSSEFSPSSNSYYSVDDQDDWGFHTF